MTSRFPAVHVLGLSTLLLASAGGPGSGMDGVAPPMNLLASARQEGRGGPPPAAAKPPDPKQVLEGTDTDETITGGSGDDWIFGRKGNDFLVGGAGRDKIDAGEGEDTVDGGDDADILDGGAGVDTIRGGAGDDTIDTGDEADQIDGGAGHDDLDGGDGNDAIHAGPGNDILAGGDETDFLDGGIGNDRLSGEDGVDNLLGGAGDDVLLGGESEDTLNGETGDDRLDGGQDSDFLVGGQGNDTLLGSSGSDTLRGEVGHDMLFGADGDDLLDGGFGSDWLLGGPGIDVLIGSDGDDLIIIRAGDVPAGEVETINGGAGTDRLLLNGFSRVPSLTGTSQAGRRHEVDLVDPLTGGIYRITNVEQTETTQVVAKLDDGGERPVTLVLLNPSAAEATGRVLFFGPDGSVVAPASGATRGREDTSFNVPALGSLRVDAVVRGPVTAQVFSSAPLGAMVRGAGAGGAAGLAEAALVDSVIVPVHEHAATSVATGVLIVNSALASNLKLGLNRLDGNETDGPTFVGAKELELAPYAHRVVFFRDLFPALGDFQGTLTIDGVDGDRPQEGGPIAVTALERGAGGRVTAFPATTIGAAARTGAPLHVLGVTTGGVTANSLVLLNASMTGNAQGIVRFYTDAGAPWLVSTNGRAPAASVPFELENHAGIVLTLPTGAAAQQGWARIETTQGVVGAMLRVAPPAGGAIRLPAVEATPGVFAAVRRDRANNLTTRLSVASSGSAVTLRLTLRTAAGAAVPNGTVELKLAAHGHAIRTLEQLFPSAATDAFDGTLAITAEGGAIATTVVEVAGTAVPMLLPIVPMP